MCPILHLEPETSIMKIGHAFGLTKAAEERSAKLGKPKQWVSRTGQNNPRTMIYPDSIQQNK